jgi:hypothetical protein
MGEGLLVLAEAMLAEAQEETDPAGKGLGKRGAG